MHVLDKLCLNADHSDVTFVVEDTKIPAHKTILLARCSYFQRLLCGGFAEATQSEIKLKVPLDAFKMILRFIYTGYMSLDSLNVDQIIDVYDLAEIYELKPLNDTISVYLATKLSLENCFDILNAACLYSRDDLQNKCLALMDRQSTEILQHDSFRSLSSTSLCTLLERDSFYALEIDIFNAVKNWTTSNSTADSKVRYKMKNS